MLAAAVVAGVLAGVLAVPESDVEVQQGVHGAVRGARDDHPVADARAQVLQQVPEPGEAAPEAAALAVDHVERARRRIWDRELLAVHVEPHCRDGAVRHAEACDVGIWGGEAGGGVEPR